MGTVTNEETKTLLHGIKEKRKAQSNILKKQQTFADGPKKHKELLEKVTMTRIWKVNASSERTKEINV
ncbi:unnamed protein product [Wuchereria bancrofti]|nr:unnamed protein product [Wuchereria bancrofti]